MTDFLDPITLAATAATIAAVVWIGHRADVARRAQCRPPVVLDPCEGLGNRLPHSMLVTTTHRPWLIVPEGIGGGAVLAQAEAGTHPTHPTFCELVLPLDGCGADAQVSSPEPPPCP